MLVPVRVPVPVLVPVILNLAATRPTLPERFAAYANQSVSVYADAAVRTRRTPVRESLGFNSDMHPAKIKLRLIQ